MSVIGGGCINGIAQLQPIDDSCGAQIQIIFNPFFKNFVRNTACSKGVYIDRKRPGDADGIAELNFTLSGSFGSDNMLGDITRHVRCASIYCDPETFRILLAVSPEEYQEYTLKQLLPMGFGPENLGKGKMKYD